MNESEGPIQLQPGLTREVTEAGVQPSPGRWKHCYANGGKETARICCGKCSKERLLDAVPADGIVRGFPCLEGGKLCDLELCGWEERNAERDAAKAKAKQERQTITAADVVELDAAALGLK